MFLLENNLSLKTFVYPFEYDFKSHYNIIAPGHLLLKRLLYFFYKNKFVYGNFT